MEKDKASENATFNNSTTWDISGQMMSKSTIIFFVASLLASLQTYLGLLNLGWTYWSKAKSLYISPGFNGLIFTTCPSSLLAGLISLHCGRAIKFSLWSFNVMKHYLSLIEIQSCLNRLKITFNYICLALLEIPHRATCIYNDFGQKYIFSLYL